MARCAICETPRNKHKDDCVLNKVQPTTPRRTLKERWRAGAMKRASVRRALRKRLDSGCKFALAVVGATLISYGAYGIFEPAGWITAGLFCFVIEWRLDGEEEDG